MRLWREAGPRGFLALWSGLLALGGLAGAALFALGGGMAVFALVPAAPMAMAAAPLIAEDRWREALAVLIPIGAAGAALRVVALVAFDGLAPAGLLFAFEPLVGGILLARRSRLISRRRDGRARPAFTALHRAAPPLMLAMAATTLFWRSPVLIAEAMLEPADILRIAFAMQAIGGFLLAPNAVAQSILGRMAVGGVARPEAAMKARRVGLAAGAAALLLGVIAGEELLTLVYGPAAAGAGQVLVLLAPLVALGAFWRIAEFEAGLDGRAAALLAARLAALGGQAGAMLALAVWPLAGALAAITALSLGLSVALSAIPFRGTVAARLLGPRPRQAEAPERTTRRVT